MTQQSNLRLPADTATLLDQIRRAQSSPAIPSNAVSSFLARTNVAGGIDVTFTLTDSTGISALTLARAVSPDPASGTVLQSWSPATPRDYLYTDAGEQGAASGAFYYLTLSAVGANGKAAVVGPVSLALAPDTSTPTAPTSLSVGHGPASNGSVPVYAVVSGATSPIRVYVSGYQGNAGAVLVASGPASPLTFSLLATGETVTVTAVTVNGAGVESAPTAGQPLTLSPGPTSPPTPAAPTVTQIPSGNQLTWPSDPDPSVTTYTVYRQQRTDATTSAILATVTATSASSVTYLDTAGLTGDFAYTLTATSPSGTSAATSPAASPAVTLSSAQLPPNVSSNVTNNATIDSVSVSGMYALIRVYGPGGVGTGYTHYVGSGSAARPNGTISGCQFKTQYAVVYDTSAKSYIAYLMTDYPSTLPDTYELVGYHTTVSTGAASGSGATAVAVLGSAGTVVQVNVTNSGSDYDNAEVDFGGGGGSGAAAHANISAFGGHINSITVDNGGAGYTSPPTVTIVSLTSDQVPGGGGSNSIYVGGARYNSNPATFGGD